MNRRAVNRHLAWIWRLAYLAAVTAALYAVFRDWAYDDPFITFRYARNLAAGLGFVYNPGEPILSTTTPLFTLLLAGFAPPGAAMPRFAVLIGAASLAAGGLLLHAILLHFKPRTPASALIGLLLYPTIPLLASTLSSETPLYLALCLGALLCYLRSRYTAAGLLLALATLTRGDGLVLAGILALDWLLRRRRATPALPWRGLLAFALVTLPWLAYSWLTFGSPVPNTLAVKQAQGRLPTSIGFLEGLRELAQDLSLSPGAWVLLVLLVLGLAVGLRRRSEMLLIAAWTLAYTGSYAVLGVTSSFWYYAPLVPGVLAAAAEGLDALAGQLQRVRLPRRVPLHSLVSAAAAFALLAGQAGGLRLLSANPDPRIAIYQAIGEWFTEYTPEDTSIGILEVGMIGYYAAPRPMVDFAGLIRPEVAEHFGAEYSFSQAALWVAEHYQPDYLVIVDGNYMDFVQQYASVRCVRSLIFYGAEYGYSRNVALYLC